jgi:hypothetical protein
MIKQTSKSLLSIYKRNMVGRPALERGQRFILNLNNVIINLVIISTTTKIQPKIRGSGSGTKRKSHRKSPLIKCI